MVPVASFASITPGRQTDLVGDSCYCFAFFFARSCWLAGWLAFDDLPDANVIVIGHPDFSSNVDGETCVWKLKLPYQMPAHCCIGRTYTHSAHVVVVVAIVDADDGAWI